MKPTTAATLAPRLQPTPCPHRARRRPPISRVNDLAGHCRWLNPPCRRIPSQDAPWLEIDEEVRPDLDLRRSQQGTDERRLRLRVPPRAANVQPVIHEEHWPCSSRIEGA